VVTTPNANAVAHNITVATVLTHRLFETTSMAATPCLSVRYGDRFYLSERGYVKRGDGRTGENPKKTVEITMGGP